MSCKNILVIEDETPVREAICDVLEIQGFNVTSAADGQAALEYLNSTEQLPCMILLDLMMPRMNGWQFLDQHQADPRLSSIPVVLCSAYKESAAAIKTAAVITKPLQRNTLLQIVNDFCA
jgi:CheY-like chemotaxis protein